MDRLELIKRNTQEVIGEERLNEILKRKEVSCYCGYETSGEIHLGHLVTISKLLDLQKAGVKVKVLFADWHTWLNRKGDWDFIHKQVNVWKKGFIAAGLKKAQFVLGSKFQRKIEYIDDVLIMSLNTTISRALRSMQVVARDIEHARVSQVIYPFMQVADIKHLNVDLVVAGLDQRKIHMMGVDGLFKEINYKTPIFIHTPIITSLSGPGSKMSSSDKGSFISIRDSDKDIKEKINRSYCVAGEIENNPVLEILKLIIFPRIKSFEIKRDKRFGGDLIFNNYDEVELLFKEKGVHPADLKKAIGEGLIKVITPIRNVFNKA